MSYVDTQSQSERLTVSVTQAVYETVFENAKVARDVAAEQAAKRRAEEAARKEAESQAAQQSPADGSRSPSVILDVSTTAAQPSAPSEQASTPPNAVDILA